MIQSVIETCLIIIAWAIVITQLLVPILKGTKLFPILRKDRKVVEEEITEVKEQIELEDLKKELEVLRKKIKKDEE